MIIINKRLLIISFILLSSLVSIYHIVYYSYSSSMFGILAKVIKSLASINLILSILVWYHKVLVSMLLLIISEMLTAISVLFSNLASESLRIVEHTDVFTSDSLLSIAILISIGVILVRGKSQGITRNELINMKPFQINVVNQIMIIVFYVTTVLSMENQLRSSGITLLAVGFSLAPTFLLLLTVVPIHQVVYLRAVYYLVWMYIICIGIEPRITSSVSLTEPLVYFISCVISIISLGGVRSEKYR